MPNWCYTDIEIRCENCEDAKQIHDRINSAISKSRHLSSLLLDVGYTNDDIEHKPHPRCRGTIEDEYYDDGEDIVFMYTETAWCPMLKCIKEFLDKAFPNVKYEIIYITTEEGAGTFETNDPNIVGLYRCYCDDDSEGIPVFDDLFDDREMRTNLLKFLKLDASNHLTTDELIDRALYEFDSLSINKYEFVSLDESIDFYE